MEEQITVQMEQMQVPTAAAAGMGLGMIFVMLVFYVFMAFCLAHMATKMGRSFGKSFILALIPIVNVFWLIGLSGKPYWWFILFLIPIVNLVVTALVWMSIAEKRGFPGWYGIMIIIPIIGIIFFFILVFGKGNEQAHAAA